MGVIALQWFTRTKHIYSVPMADSAGAVLLSKKFFDALPEDQRKLLLEISAKHLALLNALSRQENEKALESLQKQGLKVSGPASPETLKQYEELGRKARRELAGKLYPAELLDKVEKALEDQRRGKTKKS